MTIATAIGSNDLVKLFVAAALAGLGMARPPLVPDRFWRFLCWAIAASLLLWLIPLPLVRHLSVTLCVVSLLALASLVEAAQERPRPVLAEPVEESRELLDVGNRLVVVSGGNDQELTGVRTSGVETITNPDGSKSRVVREFYLDRLGPPEGKAERVYRLRLQDLQSMGARAVEHVEAALARRETDADFDEEEAHRVYRAVETQWYGEVESFLVAHDKDQADYFTTPTSMSEIPFTVGNDLDAILVRLRAHVERLGKMLTW